MSEKIVNGLYFAVVALADLISIPYVLYTLSEIEKILNGIISCGRCFSQSRKFSISVMYTFYGSKDIHWSIYCVRCYSRPHKTPYVLYTPSISEMTFIGVYLVIDA